VTESEPRFGRRSKLAQRWLTDGRGFDLRLPLSVTQDHWKTPVKAMTVAYEDVLRELKLADRADPLTEMIAKKIIELAQNRLPRSR
jgi:hypothetical protein